MSKSSTNEDMIKMVNSELHEAYKDSRLSIRDVQKRFTHDGCYEMDVKYIISLPKPKKA